MAKSKINYSALKKTADGKGVMFCTTNGENYLFNSFCVIKGLDDVQFEIAVEKSSAKNLQTLQVKNLMLLLVALMTVLIMTKPKKQSILVLVKLKKMGKLLNFSKFKIKTEILY